MLAMEHSHEQNQEQAAQQAPVDIQVMKEAIAHHEASQQNGVSATEESQPFEGAQEESLEEPEKAKEVAETENTNDIEVPPVTSVQDESVAPVSQPQTNGSSSVITPLIKVQLKHCSTVLRGLKRHAQAGPFLFPVDPVALGIPDYPTVITNPMDFSTIQKKLDGSDYESAEQFHDDVKLMLNNCYTYNKPETQVYGMAKSLEKYFDGQWAKLPTDLSSATPTNNDFGVRRRKSEATPVARPRRESAIPQRSSSIIPAPAGSRTKRSSPELTFCMNTWKELTKKSNLNISWPFLEPVDPVKLGIPDYLTVVKNPMDLSTMKKKLDAGAYNTADEFEADFRLIVENCLLYNGAESEISKLAHELTAVFERKWATKPIPGAPSSSATYTDYDVDADKILTLNKQIQILQKELDELITRRQSRPVSKSATPAAAPKPKPKAPATMSFEEKRQLSVDVNNLSPEKLGKVVEIIHNSMPNLQQQSDSDVIELDMESLDIKTLRELQKYVNECKGITKKRKAPGTGVSRPKKAASTAATGMAEAAPALEEAMSSDDSSSSDDDMA